MAGLHEHKASDGATSAYTALCAHVAEAQDYFTQCAGEAQRMVLEDKDSSTQEQPRWVTDADTETCKLGSWHPKPRCILGPWHPKPQCHTLAP